MVVVDLSPTCLYMCNQGSAELILSFRGMTSKCRDVIHTLTQSLVPSCLNLTRCMALTSSQTLVIQPGPKMISVKEDYEREKYL